MTSIPTPAPAGHEDDIEALIACLGDDASQIRNEYNRSPNEVPEEWADTMEEAAATILSLCSQLDAARASPAPQEPTLQDMIRMLERRAANTDTDPRWLAARELRRLCPELEWPLSPLEEEEQNGN